MSERDFRYTMPDGSEVEAFQLTPSSRYREKEWPEWMNSRYLVTYDHGEERLVIGNNEQVIPSYGWIVRDAGGTIKAVDYSVMEEADKVVKEVKVVHPEAKVDEEALLELGAKLTGKSVEDLRAEQAAQKPPPDLTVVQGDKGRSDKEHEPVPNGLSPVGYVPVGELTLVYEALLDEPSIGIKLLRGILSKAVTWCDCSPGNCRGDKYSAGCRVNSPLVKEP